MPVSGPARQSSRFRGDIEGLRAVAVLAVVAAHVGVPGLAGGFLGVDIFYVISGFLIAGLMYREAAATGRISIIGFYSRRARRILPAALFVLGAVVVAARLLLNPLRAASVATDALWSSLFAVNVRFIHQGTDYFGQGGLISPLQHYWSLAVEEQFYLVLPVLFVLVRAWSSWQGRSLARWILGVTLALSVASLAWSVLATAHAPASAYFSSLTRAWQLGAGALLGVGVRAYPLRVRPRLGNLLGVSALLGLAGSIAFIDGADYPGAIALFPTLATVALLASGSLGPDGIAQRLLRNRVLGYVGRISFSLYLWHWPVIVFAGVLWPTTDPYTRIPALVAASLALAALSYRLIERPFLPSRAPARANAQRPARRASLHGLQIALVMSLVFIAPLSVAPAITASSPSSFVMSRRALAPCASPRIHTPSGRWTCKLRGSLRLPTIPRDLHPPLTSVLHDREDSGCLNVTGANLDQCRWGSASATKTVAVIGDSHAEMWLTPLRAAFPADRYQIQSLTMGRCPNAVITRVEPKFPGLTEACDAHRRWVWSYLARTHPDVIVMSDSEGFRYWRAADGKVRATGTVNAWAQGLGVTLQTIRPYGRRIVLIGQTPRVRRIADCLPPDLRLAPCYGGNYMALQRSIERRAVTAVGGAFIDPGPWLCYHGTCPPVIDGTVVFWDNSHLTRTMARKLIPEFRSAMSRALRGQRSHRLAARPRRPLG